VLSNHKAFLFDRSKNLLVIPASISTIKDKSNTSIQNSLPYGVSSFRGFLVYKLDLNGFSERGRIATDTTNAYWWGAGGSRSMYIGNYLITFAGQTLQSHNLTSLAKVDNLKLK
jgi:inhibitor of cysteine peptidase